MFIAAIVLFVISMSMFVDKGRTKGSTVVAILFMVAAFIALMVSADPH
jgi:hypothetical protein